MTEEFLWRDGRLIVQPFAEVRMDFTTPVSDPPHTEDWRINPHVAPELIRLLSSVERRDFLEAHLDPSVDSIFGAPMQDDRYICKGDGERSLGTILTRDVSEISYRQRRYDDGEAKWDYRMWFTDQSGDEFALAVTDLTFRNVCDHLRDRKGWDTNRVSGRMTQFFSAPKRAVYLRIGLARGWEKHPDRCYMQVTGVYSFPDYLRGRTLGDFV